MDKFPIIDECWYIQKNMEPELQNLLVNCKHRSLRKMVSRGFFKIPDLYFPELISWPKWYLSLRGNNVRASLHFRAGRFLRNFLEKDQKFIPSLCFGTFNWLLNEYQKSISPKFPTVLLHTWCHYVPRVTMNQIYTGLDKIFHTYTPFNSLPHQRGVYPNLNYDSNSKTDYKHMASGDFFDDIYNDYDDHGDLEGFVQGFSINASISNHKVVITDWTDRRSRRPNPTDEEFPIKAFIHFTLPEKCGGRTKQAIKKVSEGSNFDVTGVSLDKEAWYHDFFIKGFQESVAISIAFAGKKVGSAVWERKFKREPWSFNCSSNMDRFKRNLKFPFDCRVIGFVSGSYSRRHGCLDKAIQEIRDTLFPSIKCVSITQSFLEKPFLRVHLVRI
ncbi:uncharacterized protein LOC141850699 [Brevipalpus obovatus]|uniref:uncharacterized protein LOC141850699 n=1 Tax=Brevipalpus obovatus TaxID=246614 RepID=UPI003D9F1B06